MFVFFVRRKILGLLFIFIAFIFFVYENYQERLNKQKNYAIFLETITKIKNSDYSSISLEKLSSLDVLNLDNLEQGRQEMQKHKIVIVGIARDNIKDLLVTIKHVEYLGGFFKDYRVIIFENDSTDGTKEAFDAWQKNKKVKIISKTINKRKRSSHQFMADIRNNYIEALKNDEYADFDIVAVLDMDMSFGFDVRGAFDSFSKIDQWDGVCSNGISNRKGKMYDAFAFRSSEFPFPPEKWQEICTKKDLNNKYSNSCNYSTSFIRDLIAFRVGFQSESRLYWLKIVPQVQKYYPVNTKLVPVDSCFGGIAFYKKQFIEECEYKSLNNDCEHVYFHECMRKKNGFRMVMNPSQIIRYSHYIE